MKIRAKKKLKEEIRDFRKTRSLYAIPLLLIGILGLVLPIIPGILLIVYGLMLLVPGRKMKIFSVK